MRVLLPVLLLAAVSASVQAQSRPFDVRDLVALDRVSSPTLSPDARLAVYAVREADVEANKSSTGLWLLDLAARKAEPRRFTPDGFNVNSPAFSPDGAQVYFLSGKSGSMQLWRQPVAGGEPVQVSDYPLPVGSYTLSPQGDAVALSFDVFPGCAADLACTRERLDNPPKGSGQHYDKLFVRHWDTWKDGTRSQLFAARIDRAGKAGTPALVSRGIDGDVPSKPFGGSEDYAWAPDGASLAFAVRIAGKSEAWSTNFDIYRAELEGQAEPVNLTVDNRASDSGPMFSADGRTLYYRAMRRPGFEADRYALMALDLQNMQRREIAPHWDRSASDITLSADGRRIYSTADDLGSHVLFAIDIASGKVSKVLRGGSVGGYDLAGDTLLYTRSQFNAPGQLFMAHGDGRGERQLTRLNAERLQNVAMGGYQQFQFKGWNDETVYGYVVKPANFEPGKKYPVAFLIHGGPQGSFGDDFHYRWNAQTYAGAGFAVVTIDFHGSTGYGQAFTDSISRDWGGKPLVDLQKGWAAAQQQFDFLDGGRACALGGSYGGYMVNWIAGQWPEAFRCLVSHAGVFDARMMGFNTEELWFSEWENGGTPWQVPENYERFNPINHVDKWKAPMLVIHGQLDYRVLVEQGLAAFGAAQRRGIDSELLYFPDENHWILKPHNSIQWHDAVNAWLKRHTAE